MMELTVLGVWFLALFQRGSVSLVMAYSTY